MAKFILAVSEDFREHREVSYYAERLCITPKHLSAGGQRDFRPHCQRMDRGICDDGGQSALKSTDLTVQEVAARLNFANQSFFGKYFKHQTGMSPSAYRRAFS